MFEDAEDPEIQAALQQQINLPKMKSASIRYLSCSRCGNIGHTADKCPENIPSTKQMQSSIESRIQTALGFAPLDWENDEDGLYLPSNEEKISEKRSWNDGPFCFNCGQFGHEKESCLQPTYKQLYDLFSQTSLNRTDQKSTFEKKQLIAAINVHCNKNSNEIK